ncbi:MAG: nitrous oxide-stimulated promoter family protein [Sphaerochaetaceae bacterium]|jgi:hypothetical protein|nr:nitrous oxide-stimulated promoter family protein [Sphaerochaetaceae bacterium]NLO61186.1 nitrous oxide-stimulated promoter family protein [Spirochaetales bacterium]MDD2406475.1 nitrous oxide-stimulated promoter family protein [Sphaerochaetaceae bacterium]MDD4259450.1 nitrous oxide-stimulated promoter family protein [Sphaerochaetaceae bacterium]MDD4762450.1 nitrous oxide-stimulated promoter family protein [Sphaerochaetaceae bacterium]
MTKLEKEKQVVTTMVRMYCKGVGHTPVPCDDCSELIEYARQRIDTCPEGMGKPFCSRCTIHCYNQEKREKIREVMRYSGPRMLWHHPIMAMAHLLGLH